MNLFAGPHGTPYISTLMKYQKGQSAKNLKPMLTQWIIAATNKENAEYVVEHLNLTDPTSISICAIGKTVALDPKLMESALPKYLDALRTDSKLENFVNQWKTKYPDKWVRAGLKQLEKALKGQGDSLP